jgi:hypothetical protein
VIFARSERQQWRDGCGNPEPPQHSKHAVQPETALGSLKRGRSHASIIRPSDQSLFGHSNAASNDYLLSLG